jgi:hypothetical protein
VNVTIELGDEVYLEARHRAVEAGCSLSGWIEEVLRRELSQEARDDSQTLLGALRNEELSRV